MARAGGALLLVLIILWIVVYILLQKKCFPPKVTRFLTKVYFFPMLPLTIGRNAYYGLWAKVDEGVYMGGVPIACLGHIDQLHALGVRAVINLQDEYKGPTKVYTRMGWTNMYMPVIDHSEPTVDQLRHCVAFIKGRTSKGEGVYIHCKGGHGRSAAVAFAWLLSEKGLEPIEVQQMLNSMRRVRKKLFRQRNLITYHMELDNGSVKSSESKLEHSPTGPTSQ
eukprot:gb/GEZN01009625.1/.p1 GENE.gb/GEZN01009625.1/~~gb/GEZN01009625.1/.p1  ORF type:complete len:223 (+),score=21.47 gb/GEZN01009625.1/:43-711(+)